MKARRLQLGLTGAALLFAAAGVVMTLDSLMQRNDVKARLNRRSADVAQLQTMRGTAERYRNAVRAFERIGAAYPVPLSGLVKACLPDQSPEIRAGETVAILPGWTLNRMDIAFSSVPLEKLADFIGKAESQRPPWRVEELRIVSSRQGDGAAQVNLTLESLGKAAQ